MIDHNAESLNHWDAYYRRHAVDDGRYLVPVVSAIVENLGELRGMWILEVGAGKGNDSLRLAKLGAKVIASDQSKESAFRIKKKVNESAGCVSVVVGDVCNLPFKATRFDLVFSQGTIEHFKDPRAALREQHFVLKSGGLILVDVPQKYNIYTLGKHALMLLGLWPGHWETQYSLAEAETMLRKGDFDIVDSYGWGTFTGKVLSYLHKRFVRRQGRQTRHMREGHRFFCTRNRILKNLCLCIGVTARKHYGER